jgi:lipoprotein-anchoring transpeptidase ErfK/SrfK
VKQVKKLTAKIVKHGSALKKKIKPTHVTVAVCLGMLLLVAGGFALLVAQYHDKALPGTSVAGTNVAGKTELEVRVIVQNLRDNMKFNLIHGDKVVAADADDLGVKVDIDKTAAGALAFGQTGNVFSNYNPLSVKRTNLVVDYDIGKTQDFLNTKFPELTVQARDATIAYNPDIGQFEVQPGEIGKTIDARQLMSKIAEVVARPHVANIDVAPTESTPLISNQAAAEARDYMNARIGLRLNLNYQGQLLYFVDPPDIAAWADFTPNPNSGKIDIEFDKAKIKQFLTDKVAPNLAMAPVDRKVLVGKDGNELVVVQPGRKGRQPRDMAALVDQVYTAVTRGEPLNQELDLAEADFKTIKIEVDDTNWIEVNLSNQTAMLWNGTNLIQTFVISSGVARSPTVTGEFRVWYKTRSQTMTGGSRADGSYYSLPNVEWVSYFYQDYAFHGKYWNNVYGAPSSHGCINMRNEDAKVVYDFAPIGTKVVVHY